MLDDQNDTIHQLKAALKDKACTLHYLRLKCIVFNISFRIRRLLEVINWKMN